jgi:hypothetical protein
MREDEGALPGCPDRREGGTVQALGGQSESNDECLIGAIQPGGKVALAVGSTGEISTMEPGSPGPQ